MIRLTNPKFCTFGRLLTVCGFCTLAACAPLEQRPVAPPLPQVVYREVLVPTPVPCFTEAERPVLQPPTPIDLANATVDQMAAALAADFAEEERYAKAVDNLFDQCKAQGVTR